MNDACKDKSLNVHSVGWMRTKSNSTEAKRTLLAEERQKPLERSLDIWISNSWKSSKLQSVWLGLNTSTWLISFIHVHCGCQCGSQLLAWLADLCKPVAHFCFEMLLALVTSCLQGGMLAPVQHLDSFLVPELTVQRISLLRACTLLTEFLLGHFCLWKQSSYPTSPKVFFFIYLGWFSVVLPKHIHWVTNYDK